MERPAAEIDVLEYQKSLGERIRRFRRERDLTQLDLARQVGVTNGQISTIERGLSAPSIGTLRRISEALALPMTAFFEETPVGSVEVVRKSERRRLTTPGSPEVLEVLAASRAIAGLQVGIGPGQTCRRPGHDSPSDLFIIIQQGQIDLECREERLTMKTGDSARLDGRLGRVYRATSDAAAIVLEVRSDRTPSSL